MTTSKPLEDRQTTPLTVDDIPGPKGLPVVGNMFDVPADTHDRHADGADPRVRSDDQIAHPGR